MQILPKELQLNLDEEVEHICTSMRELLRSKLHKRGLIIAISGGIDSAVCAALAVKAIGKSRVYGLLLPEHDSSSASVDLGRLLADQLGIEYELQNISATLEEIGCYRWRDRAIQIIFPDYKAGWKNKIVISGGTEGQINRFNLVVQSDKGETLEKRMGLKEYLQIMAATNFKQRVRKNIEYFHADKLNYAVIGTPNRLEFDQGFFVKNGDGAADIKPIAHLYKSQVYALAEHLGIPSEICNTQPTTDTYSLAQGQDEFYFSLPYQQMDIALWCSNNAKSAEELANKISIDLKRAEYVLKDIANKRKTTANLHYKPLLVRPVDEIQ
ncbi:MAG: NAD(+) synthase [Gammaproteobacteria bacterium]|nr:NAD(+) synthase [Gammaproteobacteria bacterium]